MKRANSSTTVRAEKKLRTHHSESQEINKASCCGGTKPASDHFVTPTSEEIKSQMHQAFVNDEFSADCEKRQNRPFIKTGVKPAIGQRIELTMFLHEHIRRLPFRLSGEVISVGPSPNWHPSSSLEDAGPGKGSMCCADAVRYHETGEQIKNVEPSEAWVGAWERMPLSKKQYYKDYFVNVHGALHGQTMVCEAR